MMTQAENFPFAEYYNACLLKSSFCLKFLFPGYTKGNIRARDGIMSFIPHYRWCCPNPIICSN